MDHPAARTLEKLVDHGASACLGGAAGFAASAAFGTLAVPLFASVFAYALSWRLLARVKSAPVARPLDELVLDAPMRVPSADSRVVRLFDPAAMPVTRSSPSSRGDPINDRPSVVSADASQALRDALNELRRSLR